MKKFICEELDEKGNFIMGSGCGEVPYVIFEGYFFGDRILEDVKFKAFIKNGRLAVDSVDDWDTDPYLSGLSKTKWMKQALIFAKSNDIAECPLCSNEINAQPIEESD